MGGATRFMTLLTAPVLRIRPSLVLIRRRISSSSIALRRLPTLSSSSRTKNQIPQLVNCLHSKSTSNEYALHSTVAQYQQNHPWPEWAHFVNVLSSGQGLSAPEDHGIPPEDAFVVYEELSDDFVRDAAACLAFARARPNLLGSLSRRDIEAVVSNGTPFLFRSALDTATRMRTFLGTDGSSVSELDKANTIDLMKYILSYASNPIVSSERKGLYSRELVDSSIRNLLHELGTVSSGIPTSCMPDLRQTQKPFGQNIEMKRGDWICRKCNFMNFAKNVKCLECEEPRPKRQLTGGEWDCPQCNFFNYGRNLVCLRCECRRPGAPLLNNNSSQSGLAYNGDYSSRTNRDTALAENVEPQRWLSKISQPNSGNDRDSAALDEDFPEIMPTKKIENRLPANTHLQNNSSNNSDICSKQVGFSEFKTENFQFPKDSTSQIDIHDREKERDEKSERWFKKMAELYDIKDLPSSILDEDFPEIMPMRKGESRFVVSKKKDRSLTSPKYLRQVATDQANNTNSVPFVPFPPRYFSRKDTEQSNDQDSPLKVDTNAANTNEAPRTNNQPTSSTVQFSGSNVGPTSGKTWTDGYSGTRHASNTENGRSSSQLAYNEDVKSNNVGPTGGRTWTDGYSGMEQASTSENGDSSSKLPKYKDVRSNNVGPTGGRTWTDGSSGTGQALTAENGGYSSQEPKYENVKSSWTGKSLEGSAVKEPDPLDMSEEAKAERWFKRVAQIKDISELSQIPDEDFPSIMPMRKGVNRFVVSKRKTPLERRLTSQQYRKNLPIVSSESVKKESNNS